MTAEVPLDEDTLPEQNVPPFQGVEASAPAVVSETSSAPVAEVQPAKPAVEEKIATERHPPKPKIELIKNEEIPREPSKKLPNIFYDD